MANSDARSKRVTGTGAIGIGRVRIQQLLVSTSSTSSHRLTITDGDGGDILLDLDLKKANETYSVDIPSNGILSRSDPYVATSNNVDAFTIFFV